MKTPGSSTTSASADAPSSWGRRAWAVGLALYALVAAADFADHLAQYHAIGYPEVAVSFSASLFWPVDFIARALLAG